MTACYQAPVLKRLRGRSPFTGQAQSLGDITHRVIKEGEMNERNADRRQPCRRIGCCVVRLLPDSGKAAGGRAGSNFSR